MQRTNSAILMLDTVLLDVFLLCILHSYSAATKTTMAKATASSTTTTTTTTTTTGTTGTVCSSIAQQLSVTTLERSTRKLDQESASYENPKAQAGIGGLFGQGSFGRLLGSS